VPFEFNVDDLKDALGEDLSTPLREKVIQPVQAAMNALQGQVQEMSAWIGEQERRRAVEVVDRFFTGIAEKYGDAYGQPGKRTMRQQRAYQEAVGLADQLLAGARASGRSMTEDQALEDAVYLHQKPGDQERRIRDGKTGLSRKTKEVGTRATQRGKKPATGREAALASYREWHRKAFG